MQVAVYLTCEPVFFFFFASGGGLAVGTVLLIGMCPVMSNNILKDRLL